MGRPWIKEYVFKEALKYINKATDNNIKTAESAIKELIANYDRYITVYL